MQIVSTWPRTGVTSWALPGIYDSLEKLASPFLAGPHGKELPIFQPSVSSTSGLGFPPLNPGFFWALLFTCKTCEFVAFLVWFVVVFCFVLFFELVATVGGKGGAERRFEFSNLLSFPSQLFMNNVLNWWKKCWICSLWIIVTGVLPRILKSKAVAA